MWVLVREGVFCNLAVAVHSPSVQTTKALYDFKVTTASGAEVDLSDYRGRVVLVVNTASKCGFTPQYDGLEQLWKTYKDRGLVVLGFPCNQFGAQEPDGTDKVVEFCRLNYGVSFPIHQKIEVNGPGADPLFSWLKVQAPGLLGTQSVKWNFTKFLIDRNDEVVTRFAPMTKPEQLHSAIEELLNRPYTGPDEEAGAAVGSGAA